MSVIDLAKFVTGKQSPKPRLLSWILCLSPLRRDG